MLTLPPGLAGIAEREGGAEVTLEMRTREWKRTEKWRRMAKLVSDRRNGEGMIFDFDTRDPKVVDASLFSPPPLLLFFFFFFHGGTS